MTKSWTLGFYYPKSDIIFISDWVYLSSSSNSPLLQSFHQNFAVLLWNVFTQYFSKLINKFLLYFGNFWNNVVHILATM
jgi:hypothetical protein